MARFRAFIERVALPVAALAGLALAAGCTGNIAEPAGATVGPSGPGAAGGSSTGAGGQGVGDPTTEPPFRELIPFAPAPAGMRRLTAAQLTSSMNALLPAGIGAVELPPDIVLGGFSSIGAAQASYSERGIEQLESAALAGAARILDDGARRTAFVGCDPAQAACVRQFVAAFGRRAWRRPLATEELDRYSRLVAELAADLASPWEALKVAVGAMLQSPHFLYRVELGEPDPADPTRLRYTSHEMAGRLSFLLWGRTPDDALLAAADAGRLVETAGIDEQVVRLRAAAATRDAALIFFHEYAGLEAELHKDPSLFPDATPALWQSMRGEAERLLSEIAFGAAPDFRQAFDAPFTFVDAALAKFYGLASAPGAGFAKVALPAEGPRGGLLTTGAFLAQHGFQNRGSPTLRGRFVRQHLLCAHVPDPPENVDATLPSASSGNQTLRQMLEVHMVNPACSGCHAMMDPIGFAFENFDAIGRYRTTDSGLPIDATGDLDGRPFDGARDLARLVVSLDHFGACLVRQAYRHATGHLEEPGEEIVLAGLATKLKEGGYDLLQLFANVAQSDGFRFAARPR